ncbi:MAG TPA: insulinase family protein [Anaerolinea thermolimosa]|uniref:Insulinase family protein n=1 Tax=Anaerolinea thermolimosa TaxID=229919 RepID=A0A3D1JE42_9CHLR|nr:insulinase family protein [Anaerolinea thermolimosa]
MSDPTLKVQLSNGLTVHLKEIHTAPLISHWIWYRVGSRDEPAGLTGVSHWVEHMQFKGTPRYPATVLDRAISREGGMWNAFTYLDWTTYFETLPADKISLALELEADRMVNSLFDPEEVESERTVILAEREGHENEPLFRLGEAVQTASFRVHPYRHEIIGDKEDLRRMTRDDLYRHYRTYYNPNNALIAMAGDFEAEAMLQRLQELYAPLSAVPLPERVAAACVEPPPQGEQQLEVTGPGQTTYIQISYRSPAAAHPDFATFTIIDSLLTGPSSLNMFGGGGISNKTSRLYRALVDRELAVSVGGSLQATLDPFLYDTIITVHPQRTPQEALAAYDAQIRRLQEEWVSSDEIARAIKQARALFAYGSENITNQAFWLGYAEMFASYDWFTGYLENLSRVTPDEIMRVAQTAFQAQNRVVGVYLPDRSDGGGKEP